MCKHGGHRALGAGAAAPGAIFGEPAANEADHAAQRWQRNQSSANDAQWPVAHRAWEDLRQPAVSAEHGEGRRPSSAAIAKQQPAAVRAELRELGLSKEQLHSLAGLENGLGNSSSDHPAWSLYSDARYSTSKYADEYLVHVNGVEPELPESERRREEICV